MAMKKSDFQKFDPADVDVIERRIDHSLSMPGDRNLTFNCAGWSAAVKAEIQRRYEAAGWKVEWYDDQRDGNFMWLK